MRFSLRLFVAALAVTVMVCVMLALAYGLTEAYGLKAKKLVLLMRLVVLAIFSAGLLIFWIVRYRQTSHDLEMLREEIERNRRAREKLERHVWGSKSKRAVTSKNEFACIRLNNLKETCETVT